MSLTVTESMKKAGARALVNLGLLPCEFGSGEIAETVFQEMMDAADHGESCKTPSDVIR